MKYKTTVSRTGFLRFFFNKVDVENSFWGD